VSVSNEPLADGPVWQAIRRHLQARREAICAELRDYPQPIAGCDVQFNHLSELRDAVFRETERLAAAMRRAGAAKDGGAAAEAFLAASPFIDRDAARRIREAAGLLAVGG
jgi:hypothetical protein